MRAVVYTSAGGPEVSASGREADPGAWAGAGEVRVRIHVSGVNPDGLEATRHRVDPRDHRAGAQSGWRDGVIDSIGQGVPESRLGQRVWIWEAAWQRADGTAQEYVVLPERQSVPLPDNASFELGASLGIPAVTAHRTLTVAEGGPERLRTAGALAGRTVLVAGGAGAVGNAAIQLARWAGAGVITTVSRPPRPGWPRRQARTMSSTTAPATPSSRSARSRPKASTSSSRWPRPPTPSWITPLPRRTRPLPSMPAPTPSTFLSGRP